MAPGSPHRSDGPVPATLRARDALLLGLVQGPTELLPVSSSAHLTIVPDLLGLPYRDLDPDLRKSVEVALHAGTAAALLVALRRELRSELAGLDRRRAGVLFWATLPPAVIGFACERPIERRLGGRRSMAAGLAAGSALLIVADRGPRDRGRSEASAADGLLLGFAQAAALVPGISRSGSTLAAARIRGFRRREAHRLSRRIALPIIAVAATVKSVRLARRGLREGEPQALGAGIAASAASTWACARLISVLDREVPLWPFALYRLALAALVLAGVERDGDPAGPAPARSPSGAVRLNGPMGTQTEPTATR
ncbi:MAG: undecaprenyl-diphosphate phosphatase [Solirubrobacterales bacterium]